VKDPHYDGAWMTKKNSFISLRPEIVGSLMEDASVTAGDRIAPSFGQPIWKKK